MTTVLRDVCVNGGATGTSLSLARASASAIYDLYLRAWSAIARTDRARILRQTLSSETTYSDLVSDVKGRTKIARHLAEFQERRPGYFFESGGLEERKGIVRVEWVMRDPSGAAIMPGCDIVELGVDGFIWSISGFFYASALAPRVSDNM